MTECPAIRGRGKGDYKLSTVIAAAEISFTNRRRPAMSLYRRDTLRYVLTVNSSNVLLEPFSGENATLESTWKTCKLTCPE